MSMNPTYTIPNRTRLISDIYVPQTAAARNVFNVQNNKSRSIGEFQDSYHTYTRIPPLASLRDLHEVHPTTTQRLAAPFVLGMAYVQHVGNKVAHTFHETSLATVKLVAPALTVVSLAVFLLALGPFVHNGQPATPGNTGIGRGGSMPISVSAAAMPHVVTTPSVAPTTSTNSTMSVQRTMPATSMATTTATQSMAMALGSSAVAGGMGSGDSTTNPVTTTPPATTTPVNDPVTTPAAPTDTTPVTTPVDTTPVTIPPVEVPPVETPAPVIPPILPIDVSIPGIVDLSIAI